MACHVPVISTNTGGMPELNIHGVTGFLSDVGDVDVMANHAIEILSNTETLSRFKSDAALQAKKFDINVVLPVYENYYLDILNRSK